MKFYGIWCIMQYLCPKMLFAKSKMCKSNPLFCWKITLYPFSHIPPKGMYAWLVHDSYLWSNKLFLIFIIEYVYFNPVPVYKNVIVPTRKVHNCQWQSQLFQINITAPVQGTQALSKHPKWNLKSEEIKPWRLVWIIQTHEKLVKHWRRNMVEAG